MALRSEVRPRLLHFVPAGPNDGVGAQRGRGQLGGNGAAALLLCFLASEAQSNYVRAGELTMVEEPERCGGARLEGGDTTTENNVGDE